MPIDFDKQLLDPIYDGIGIPAALTRGDTDGTQVDLTVLDKTKEALLEGQNGPGVQFATIKAAAEVRVSELDAKSVSRESLKGLLLSFNGKTWKIVQSQPKPKPGGKGALLLMLQSP